MASGQVFYNPTRQQYYTVTGISAPAFASGPDGLINKKVTWLDKAPGSAGTSATSYNRPQFSQNQFTQAQLSGMGGGTTPQWMMNAYSNKIGQMGGNANQPPFGVTQSGFPGAGGKSTPAQG